MKSKTWLMIILALLVINSCAKRDQLSDLQVDADRNLSLVEARQHFEKVLAATKQPGKIASKAPRAHQHDENREHNHDKQPMWDAFQYRELSSGHQAVLTPLHRQGTYVQISDDKMVKFGFLNYMMMYKDTADNIITEWVQLKPSNKWFEAKTSRKYDGDIIVMNWDGKAQRIFRYEDGKVLNDSKRPKVAKQASITSDEPPGDWGDDAQCQIITFWIRYPGHVCSCADHTWEQRSICTCEQQGGIGPKRSRTVSVTIETCVETPPEGPIDGGEDNGSEGPPGGGR
ncbi:hypothetical protein SAMN05421747_116100 [Parapedobacter composti]|uniref:MORN repeat variant n=1 Tax=Parapedobacter composti TaxID=623281 RepID=A0A1I1KN34_9SPHI|nr:hypothetical protein [Parapedobacter composti]SFC62209.1 hypothetical protein SAMN05421747_116100 [Parapedobacter composti]